MQGLNVKAPELLKNFYEENTIKQQEQIEKLKETGELYPDEQRIATDS